MEKGNTFVLRYDPGDEAAATGGEKSENTVINPNVVQAMPRLQPQLVPQMIARETLVPAKSTSDKTKKKYIIGIAAGLVIIVMAMALVLVVVYGPLANNLNQESSTLEGDFESFKTQYQTDTEDLRREIRSEFLDQIKQLTSVLNTTKYKLSMAEKRMQSLTSSVVGMQDDSLSINTVAHANSNSLNHLQTVVGSITDNGTVSVAHFNAVEASVRELRSSRDTATTQYNSLQAVVNSINTAQHTTTAQVQDLTSRVNTPVNIYQNCSEETRSCTLSSNGGGYYVRYCSTSSLPLNSTDFYTLDSRCEYNTAYTSYYDTAVSYESSGSVYCKCGVIYPSGAYHSRLTGSFSGTCHLKIKRCQNTIRH